MMEHRQHHRQIEWITSLLGGAGCGVLLTLRFTRNVLPPSYDALLHPFPASGVFLGVLVALATVSIVASVAWTIADRFDTKNLLWVFVLAGVVSLEVYDFWVLRYRILSHWTLVVVFAVMALLGFGLRGFRLGWFKGAVRIVRGSLVVVGCSTLWMTAELLYSAARSSVPETPEVSAKCRISRSASGSRIVWLLFDELSYDQTYEHRWPGLKLPNFDRLLSESVTFTEVRPAGYRTVEVIPSLFLGRTVSQAKISAAGELSVYLADVRQWRRFDASQTIFADGRRLGWTVGIAGWHVPYCRIMAGWVDRCFWYNHEPLEDNLSVEEGVFVNAAAPFLNWLYILMPKIVSDRYSFYANLAKTDKRDYQLGMEQAQGLLRDTEIRFAYVHLNVPHPPGMYDRKAHVFSRGGSYLDNLALADEALGQLLDTLEGTRAWSDTTLIVCGDHSWRIPLWGGVPGWTQEDEAASMGRFDTRPVLSIHFPAQHVGSQITSEFPALAVHDVIEALIRGQLRLPGELARWTRGNWGRSGSGGARSHCRHNRV